MQVHLCLHLVFACLQLYNHGPELNLPKKPKHEGFLFLDESLVHSFAIVFALAAHFSFYFLNRNLEVIVPKSQPILLSRERQL
jgi:hypothetical protein